MSVEEPGEPLPSRRFIIIEDSFPVASALKYLCTLASPSD